MRQPFLLLPFLLLRAASVQVTGLGKTTVEYGADAFYKCELHGQKGVKQVTWQRRLRDNRFENVASYSEDHGQHINEPYRGKVILNETSLSSASLTLKSATWADEGCYICIFNVFPEPSKRKQTCLTLQGISEVNAMVDQPESGLTNGTATVVFSCSATGKPPPVIRWDFSHNATTLINKTVSTTVGNEDGTFTSTHSVTLLALGSWDGHVDCVVQSSSQKRTVRVPFSWDATSLEEEEEDTGGAPPKTRVISTGMVVMAVIGVIGVMVLIVLGLHIGRKPKRFKVRSIV